jgi:hypothetical protein
MTMYVKSMSGEVNNMDLKINEKEIFLILPNCSESIAGNTFQSRDVLITLEVTNFNPAKTVKVVKKDVCSSMVFVVSLLRD